MRTVSFARDDDNTSGGVWNKMRMYQENAGLRTTSVLSMKEVPNPASKAFHFMQAIQRLVAAPALEHRVRTSAAGAFISHTEV